VSETSLSVTYIGHATTLLEMDGVRILTDPVLRRRVLHLRRSAPLALSGAAPLAGVDGILISHLHFDHFDVRTLQTFDHGVTVVVPRGGAVQLLQRRGFTDVSGVDEDTVVDIGSVQVRAVHAQHPPGGTPRLRGPALGYVLRASLSIYFAGDTDVFGEMSALGGPDVALLPVAGWGPRLPEGDHMNPLRAARALRLLRPRVAIPIHWGTFAPLWALRGYPANDAAAVEFRRLASEVAPEVDVRVLEPGETCTLPAAPIG
jgi:L-ascorbate metabolism protein UlaG (beta-lactamase superfamily)